MKESVIYGTLGVLSGSGECSCLGGTRGDATVLNAEGGGAISRADRAKKNQFYFIIFFVSISFQFF